jgi:hypothetical protein
VSDPNRMAIEAIREHYEQAVARAEMLDQLRVVAVDRANNESTRAEAAEAELRELRKLVDAWKAADAKLASVVDGEQDRIFAAYEVFNAAEEALRHA